MILLMNAYVVYIFAFKYLKYLTFFLKLNDHADGKQIINYLHFINKFCHKPCLPPFSTFFFSSKNLFTYFL